jgi:hypothetical protein
VTIVFNSPDAGRSVSHVSRTIVLGVLLAFVSITPFVAVLEIHHALAAVDHDGHEHSDADLCQWVQHHAGSSVQPVLPSASCLQPVGQHESPLLAVLSSSGPNPVGPARAPPLL